MEKNIFNILKAPLSDLNLYPHSGLDESTTITEVLNFFSWNNTSSFSVTRENNVIGIFTEKDLIHKFFGINKDYSSLDFNASIANYMTKNPKVLSLNESIGSSLQMMISGGFRHIPIIHSESKKVYAVMSIRDIGVYINSQLSSEEVELLKPQCSDIFYKVA